MFVRGQHSPPVYGRPQRNADCRREIICADRPFLSAVAAREYDNLLSPCARCLVRTRLRARTNICNGSLSSSRPPPPPPPPPPTRRLLTMYDDDFNLGDDLLPKAYRRRRRRGSGFSPPSGRVDAHIIVQFVSRARPTNIVDTTIAEVRAVVAVVRSDRTDNNDRPPPRGRRNFNKTLFYTGKAVRLPCVGGNSARKTGRKRGTGHTRAVSDRED